PQDGKNSFHGGNGLRLDLRADFNSGFRAATANHSQVTVPIHESNFMLCCMTAPHLCRLNFARKIILHLL
ncbi:MAG TPA: hypothetical protein VJT54_02855, partial [Verrucomicrobiae bacterium]|nr:hypothetical protein [Verrucomicrobiae bacterium]